MKKYELTTNTKMYLGKKLFQIRALIAFGNVEAGELGGWLEKKENLSQEGDCWVTGNGRVTGNSRVTGNGRVTDNGIVTGNGRVSGNGRVTGNGIVTGNGWVSGNGRVSGKGIVTDNGIVTGNGWVSGNGRVSGKGIVTDNGIVTGNGWVTDNEDIAYVRGFGSEYRPTTFFRCEDGKIRTQCGCFYGTIDEFRKQVKETHEDSKFAKEYLMIADLMELHFE